MSAAFFLREGLRGGESLGTLETLGSLRILKTLRRLLLLSGKFSTFVANNYKYL